MSTGTGLTDRLRQPAYTGENRCTPCTVVNSIIALVVAILVWLRSPPVAAAFLVVAAGAIYFRGYLVPGTPELTKRYMPERVLAWFGKAPAPPAPGETTDVEGYLLELDAVEPAGDDLELRPRFRDAWTAAIDDADADLVAAVGDALDLEEPGVEERGDAFVVTDGGFAGAEWPSRAALLADLGGMTVLADRDPQWDERDNTERGRILAGLRIFLDTCPDCGGTPELGEDVVESCCSRSEVYTYTCPDCGARLLEVNQ